MISIASPKDIQGQNFDNSPNFISPLEYGDEHNPNQLNDNLIKSIEIQNNKKNVDEDDTIINNDDNNDNNANFFNNRSSPLLKKMK